MDRRQVVIAGAAVGFPDQVACPGVNAGQAVIFALVRQGKRLQRWNEVIGGEKGKNG